MQGRGKDHLPHDTRHILLGTLEKSFCLCVYSFLVCEMGLSLSQESVVHINSEVLRQCNSERCIHNIKITIPKLTSQQ